MRALVALGPLTSPGAAKGGILLAKHTATSPRSWFCPPRPSCSTAVGGTQSAWVLTIVTYGLLHLKSLGRCAAKQPFGTAHGRCKEGLKSSHAHGEPLELQLGGAISSLERWMCEYQVSSTGSPDPADRFFSYDMIYNDNPLESFCPEVTYREHLTWSFSRQTTLRTRARV